eukprot:297063_1
MNNAVINKTKIDEHLKQNVLQMNENELQDWMDERRKIIMRQTELLQFGEAVEGRKFRQFHETEGAFYLGSNATETFHVFCSAIGAYILSKCLYWLMDGSFSWTPRIAFFKKPFGQCLVINAVF